MDARANERARVAIFALGVLTLAALVASCDPASAQGLMTDVSKAVARLLEKERPVL